MERDHAEDVVVDGRVILKCFKEIGCNVVDWIHLAVDSDKWRSVANTVMNLLVP
jgi:hypothetical protein